MATYTCKYCFRNYRKKENHDKHVPCCEFFHRSTKNHDNEMDSYEKLPSQREMYQLLREALFKCNKLEKEVEKLKNTSFVKQRKLISEYLNQPKNIPTMNFIEWSKNIEIEHIHLETVFQDDLTEGMKECIKTSYSKSKMLTPIRAFTQKQNTLYFYNNSDEEPDVYTWKIMSNDDIDKFISILSYKFLQEYMKFQRSVMEQIENDETTKENHIIYMIKINGGKCSHDRRRNEIKRIMYLKLQEDIQHLDVTF
jgi:hypothetical protein